MIDLFAKQILPMLLKSVLKPFNDENYIFELKLDGIRCVAFCQKNDTLLQNRNLKNITNTYPELINIFKQCKKKCILDGEIIYADEKGFPNFQVLQKRNLLSGKTKIEKQSQKYPVSFVAFDILAIGNKNITNLTLMERKEILFNNITENEFISVARFVKKNGIEFFLKTKELSLEGVVAKNKNSVYLIGQRTGSWLKIKNKISEDYLVCGYLPDETGDVKNLILATKKDNKFVFEGEIYVPLNSTKKFIYEYAKKHKTKAIFENLQTNIVWIKPKLICKVDFTERTNSKTRRNPIFRGIKMD